MNLQEIEKLMVMVEQSSFTKFSYQNGAEKISFSRVSPSADKVFVPPYPPAEPDNDASKNRQEEDIYVVAPMVGTFYSAPDADSPAFVNIGDHVKSGQTVCVIEAMKLMSKIESEQEGIIEAILVSNEQKVEYGQPLFKIRSKS